MDEGNTTGASAALGKGDGGNPLTQDSQVN
jgi:hypothetical protein